MSRIILVVLFLVSQAAFSQVPRTQVSEGPILTWAEHSFDFGDIRQGDKIEHTFKFKNTGTQPLIITNVSTQCGCTAPKGWPRDPVMPGGHGEITISFDSTGKIGRQNKVATVISNAANTKDNQLLLSGSVSEKKAP